MSVIKIFDIHTTKLLPTDCQEQQIPLATVNDDLMLKNVNGGGKTGAFYRFSSIKVLEEQMLRVISHLYVII